MNEELIEAAKSGDLERVRKAIQKGANINYKDKEENATAIAWAAGCGNIEVVKFLLTFDDIDLSHIDNQNMTVLSSAILAPTNRPNETLETATLILKKIKKYDFKNLDACQRDTGTNVLMAACVYFMEHQADRIPDDITFVLDLLQRGSQITFSNGINHKVINDYSAFSSSINERLSWRPEMYQLLNSAGDLLKIADGTKDDFEENRALISKILKLLGKGLNSRRQDGNTALHLALIKNNIEFTKILIKNGADLDMPNNEGITAKQLLKKIDLTKEVDLKDVFDEKETKDESYTKEVKQLDSFIEILNKKIEYNDFLNPSKKQKFVGDLLREKNYACYYRDNYILKMAELLSNPNINVYDPKRALELLNNISHENKKFSQKAKEMIALLKISIVNERISDELSDNSKRDYNTTEIGMFQTNEKNAEIDIAQLIKDIALEITVLNPKASIEDLVKVLNVLVKLQKNQIKDINNEEIAVFSKVKNAFEINNTHSKITKDLIQLGTKLLASSALHNKSSGYRQ